MPFAPKLSSPPKVEELKAYFEWLNRPGEMGSAPPPLPPEAIQTTSRLIWPTEDSNPQREDFSEVELRELADREDPWAHAVDGALLSATIADYATAAQVARLLNRATANLAEGELESAIAGCNEAIRLDPKSACAYGCRGDGYSYKGDHDAAIADYSEAIRLDPNPANWHIRRAVVFMAKRDYDAAISDCTEAIHLDPKNACAYQPGLRLPLQG